MLRTRLYAVVSGITFDNIVFRALQDVSLVNEHNTVMPNCLVGIIMKFVHKLVLTRRFMFLDTFSFEIGSSLKAFFLYKTSTVQHTKTGASTENGKKQHMLCQI